MASYVFICLFERPINREGATERKEIFHPLVYSPGGCNSQIWARMKTGTRIFITSPTWVTGTQVLGPSSAAFPGTRQETGSEEQLGLRTRTLIGDEGIASCGLIYYATLAPIYGLFCLAFYFFNSLMFSKVIHVAACIMGFSFLFMAYL